jgi:hypothetical protein
LIKASSNENLNLLIQYNEIKQRLDIIENSLKNINNKFDCNTNKEESKLMNQQNEKKSLYLLDNSVNENNKKSLKLINNDLNKKQELTSCNSYLTFNNLAIALFAWLIGLMSAIFSKFLIKFTD